MGAGMSKLVDSTAAAYCLDLMVGCRTGINQGHPNSPELLAFFVAILGEDCPRSANLGYKSILLHLRQRRAFADVLRELADRIDPPNAAP